MTDEQLKKLIIQYDELDEKSGNRKAWMNEIFHYCIPHRYNDLYRQLNNDESLPSDIYNSAMIQAAEIFSSGIFSYLTNPSSVWLNLTTKNKRQYTLTGVPEYFEESTTILLDVLAESNFYHEIKSFFLDLTVGNAVLYAEEDENEYVRFTCINPMNCVWAEGINGKVNVLFRTFKMTAHQLVERFGDNVSEKVKKCIEAGKYSEEFEVVHGVRPRWQRDSTKLDNLNKAFESVYFEKEEKALLSESGYDTFPYFVCRYIKNSGASYGYGPGNISIYDAKMLNQTMLSMTRGIQKDVDPTLNVPSDSFVLPILQDPGAINIRTSMNPDDKIDTIRSQTNYQAVFEFIKYIVSNINSAFHVDLFLAITEQTKRMTIPEVNERIAEKFPMLGSILNRIIDEAISPIIHFVFELLSKAQILPTVPQSLIDANYSIEYVSPLSKSQKVSEVRSLQAAMQMAATVGQFDPNALDNFDFDKIAKDSVSIVGASSTYLRDDRAVAFIREQRQKQIEAMQQKQEIMEFADTAKQSAAADLSLAKATKA